MTKERDSNDSFSSGLVTIRAVLDLHGMSRRVLARVSGISERYIAQLESGKANASIVLLRRISNAMGMQLEDMIPAEGPRPQRHNAKMDPLPCAGNITTT